MQRGAVLVVGGSRGIGRAAVETLVAAGHPVVFTYRAGEDAARALEEAHAGRAFALRYDALDRQRPAALVEEAEARVGPLFGLVYCAGAKKDALAAMLPDADWDEVLETNLGGAFRVARAALPGMLRRRAGAIVNVASLSASHGIAGQAAYAASKAGLVALTRVLARECGKRGVRVNAVVPGYVATDFVADLPEAAVAALRAGECLKSGTGVQDVADAIAFLLSAKASAITGQALVVDAGSTA